MDIGKFCSLSFVVQYDPLEDEHKNPCHFLLLPQDVSLEEAELRLRSAYLDAFESWEKVPTTEDERERVARQKMKHDAIFVFRTPSQDAGA